MDSAALKRDRMVFSQLTTNRVKDERVLNAMRDVPREAFLPARLHGVAYLDEDLEFAPGRYLMEPMVLARMIMAAAIKADEVVLEIGTGCGYGTAVLGKLAGCVVSLESDEGLANAANSTLNALEIDNAAVLNMDYTEGCADQGPYDVIFVNGAVAEAPEGLVKQLKEGGRMVYVLANQKVNMGRAMVLTKTGEGLEIVSLFDAATPILTGFEGEETFTF